MNIFSRDYIMRKGSTFSEVILLEDIYMSLDPSSNYTVEGGMTLVSDGTVKVAIGGTLSDNNTKLTLLLSATQTTAIATTGNYNYAIDIALAGAVQAIPDGPMLLKDDVSKTT